MTFANSFSGCFLEFAMYLKNTEVSEFCLETHASLSENLWWKNIVYIIKNEMHSYWKLEILDKCFKMDSTFLIRKNKMLWLIMC